MAERPQVVFTVGESGSGKSYARCAKFLVDEWLKYEGQGVHYSNFPVSLDGLSEYLGKTREEIETRVQRIPAAELEHWREGSSGPWDLWPHLDEYKEELGGDPKADPLYNAHIAIDEAHLYAAKEHNHRHIAKWKAFCGGLRHRHATVEFLTQHTNKLAKAIRDEAGMRITIIKPDVMHEPFTGWSYYDFLQVLSKAFGRRLGMAWELREKPNPYASGDSWMKVKRLGHPFNQDLFKVYNSFNQLDSESDDQGETKVAIDENEPWVKFNWFQLLSWAVMRNKLATAQRLGFFFLFLSILTGVMQTTVTSAWAGAMQTMQDKVSGAAKAASINKPKPSPNEPTLAPEYAANPENPLSTPVPIDRAKERQYLQRIGKLETERARIIETNEILANRLGTLSQLMHSFTQLTAIVESRVYFADGVSLKQGDKIHVGPFQGQTIAEIDQPHGRVVLDDGFVLRVGLLSPSQRNLVAQWVSGHDPEPRLLSSPADDRTKSASSAGVRRPSPFPIGKPLPKNGPIAGKEEIPSAVIDRIRHLRRNATPPVPLDLDKQNGQVGDRLGVPGRSDRNSDVRQRGSLPSPSSRGSEDGTGSQPDGEPVLPGQSGAN